jgi:predicted nucleotidyltransferase
MHNKINLSPLLAALQPVIGADDIVLLFGSAARGELGPESDIDLLIVTAVPHKSILAALVKAQKAFGRVVEVTSYLPREFQTGLRLRNPFIRDVLRGPTVILYGDASLLKI